MYRLSSDPLPGPPRVIATASPSRTRSFASTLAPVALRAACCMSSSFLAGLFCPRAQGDGRDGVGTMSAPHRVLPPPAIRWRRPIPPSVTLPVPATGRVGWEQREAPDADDHPP